jgi:hypothetical protein
LASIQQKVSDFTLGGDGVESSVAPVKARLLTIFGRIRQEGHG